jgi:tetratricopeptide (TPR) repeat protein
MRFCQSALSLAISIGRLDRQSEALVQLAWIKIDSGDVLGAKEDASECQRVAKLAGDLFTEARALHSEATCCLVLGCYSYCISLLDEATHLLNLCGMAGGSTHIGIKNTKALVHRCKSEYVEALDIQTQILQECSVDYDHALALLNIAGISVEIGASDHDVKCNLEGAYILFHKINFLNQLVWCDIYRAVLDLRQGNLSAARGGFQSCLRSTWGKYPEATTYCLEKLASEGGPVHRASSPCAVTFLVHSIKCKQRRELHKALQFLSDVFQACGDQDTAISLLTIALEGFTKMDVHRSRAECMVRLGDISKLNGDVLKAAELWETARPLFERSSQRKQLAHLDAKLASLSHNPEHCEQRSGAGGSKSKGIQEIESISLGDDRLPVPVDI